MSWLKVSYWFLLTFLCVASLPYSEHGLIQIRMLSGGLLTAKNAQSKTTSLCSG